MNTVGFSSRFGDQDPRLALIEDRINRSEHHKAEQSIQADGGWGLRGDSGCVCGLS